MEEIDLRSIQNEQKQYFQTGATKDVQFRKKALQQLKQKIMEREKQIMEALNKDLNKSEFESYMTEIGMVLSELSYAIKHIASWSKKKRVKTPLAQFYASSYQLSEPYGEVLILAPWNYPFMLLIDPLIGAIAAGNCSILKPSEFAPHTAEVINQIITECFEEKYCTVILGDKQVSNALIQMPFDYIFYTGGTRVGKIVMEQAAKNLIPVTLELGGKSPCLVTKQCNLALAAKRITFGKLLNAGQTCVAPDYLLVDKKIKEELVEKIKENIGAFLGDHPNENPNYPKIINERHVNRLESLLENQSILLGGKIDRNKQKIEPTILDNPKLETKVMQEEIFGPILPIIEYETIEEAIEYIKQFEKPLAFYLFTTNKQIERKCMERISFGGGCINDTIIHLATPYMGFGGVGQSGIGSYHGKKSFDTFSHQRSIVKKANWIDLPIRYLPYNHIKEKLLRFFMK